MDISDIADMLRQMADDLDLEGVECYACDDIGYERDQALMSLKSVKRTVDDISMRRGLDVSEESWALIEREILPLLG